MRTAASSSPLMPINGAVKEPYRTMSRSHMEAFFVPLTGLRQTIADLADGYVYSRLLNTLFPSCLDPRRLKEDATMDRDKMANWKLFQQGLNRLEVEKDFDIRQMIKPSSVAGFEFCRWFISFFETNIQAGPPPTPRPRPPPSSRRLATPLRRSPVRPAHHLRDVATLAVVTEDDETDRAVPAAAAAVAPMPVVNRPIPFNLDDHEQPAEEEVRPTYTRQRPRMTRRHTIWSTMTSGSRDLSVSQREDNEQLTYTVQTLSPPGRDLPPLLGDDDLEEEDDVWTAVDPPTELDMTQACTNETQLSAAEDDEEEEEVEEEEEEEEEEEKKKPVSVVFATPAERRKRVWEVATPFHMQLRSSDKKKPLDGQ